MRVRGTVSVAFTVETRAVLTETELRQLIADSLGHSKIVLEGITIDTELVTPDDVQLLRGADA